MPPVPRRSWTALALPLVVLGGLVAVAGGLQAEPVGSASDEPWRLGRPDSTTVGSVALALGVLGLALLATSLVLARSRGGVQLPRRRSDAASLGLLLGAIALAALWQWLRGRPTATQPGEPDVVPTPPATTPTVAAQDGGSLLLVVGLLLVVVLLVVLAGRSRRRSVDLAVDPEPELVTAHDPVRDGLLAAATALTRSPRDDPRSRVIAAYAAFEDALGAAGVRRERHGTATALLERAVRSGADERAARRLTELFTAARWSDARMSAREVETARQLLTELLEQR